jgi:hypothetical protein
MLLLYKFRWSVYKQIGLAHKDNSTEFFPQVNLFQLQLINRHLRRLNSKVFVMQEDEYHGWEEIS